MKEDVLLGDAFLGLAVYYLAIVVFVAAICRLEPFDSLKDSPLEPLITLLIECSGLYTTARLFLR